MLLWMKSKSSVEGYSVIGSLFLCLNNFLISSSSTVLDLSSFAHEEMAFSYKSSVTASEFNKVSLFLILTAELLMVSES